jgi:hypothetical protein
VPKKCKNTVKVGRCLVSCIHELQNSVSYTSAQTTPFSYILSNSVSWMNGMLLRVTNTCMLSLIICMAVANL